MEGILILLSLSLSLCVALALGSLFLPLAPRAANAITVGFALCVFFTADVSFAYHVALWDGIPFRREYRPMRRFILFAIERSANAIDWSFPRCEPWLVNRV